VVADRAGLGAGFAAGITAQAHQVQAGLVQDAADRVFAR
jgi:hypothetical protein